MKKWITAFLALAVVSVLGAGPAWAQGFLNFGDASYQGETTYGGAPNVPHIHMFESLEDDTLFWGSYGSTPEDESDRDYLYWEDYTTVGGTPAQGSGSLWLDWQVFTDFDWGGSSALQHYLPDTTESGALRAKGDFYDLSDFTHLNFWYNTLTGANPAAQFRVKLHDASEGLGTAPSSETEDWYMQDDNMYQAQPGWNMISVPLESLGNVGPTTTGFSRPGCPSDCWSGIYGNGELDLDMISGFQLEFTTGQAGAANDSSTGGVIVWDNLHVTGVRYNTLEAFDDGGADGNWKNSNAGSYTLTSVADTVEGAAAIKIEYNITGDQGWGGSVDVQGLPSGDNYGPMEARTHLSLFYKNEVPASAPDNMALIVKVWENSDGNTEEWNWSTRDWAGPILGESSGTWRRLLVPFDELAIPSWLTTHDGVLDRNKVTQVQLQLYVDETVTSTGTILFDRLTGYGFQETDVTAPEAVADLAVTPGSYSNIVSWTDVPGEDGESYHIYASVNPITDVNATGVMEIALDVAEGSGVYTHMIYSPVVDADLSYYYAITVSDPVGNTSDVAATGSAVTNTAKALATVSMTAPAGFVADGDVGEWAAITPIHVGADGDLGHVPSNFLVSGAADLSADVYFAVDAENLYVAFDVTDDAYNPVPDGVTSERWLYDGTELYLGMYDGRAGEHASYENEAEPDYKFYFYKENVNVDPGPATLFAAGTDNYSFTPKGGGGGYVIEAKLPYADFAFPTAPAFVPMNGMRVPLDFVIMDNDIGGSSREGIITYSFDNDDNSWQTPRNWFYTWIGDKISVGVENVTTDLPKEYALHQNYPNPFNPSTLFRYDLPNAGKVTLTVFNLLGQEVSTLVDTDQAAGTYEVTFDASSLASGVYFYQLRTDKYVQSKKMMLVR